MVQYVRGHVHNGCVRLVVRPYKEVLLCLAPLCSLCRRPAQTVQATFEQSETRANLRLSNPQKVVLYFSRGLSPQRD